MLSVLTTPSALNAARDLDRPTITIILSDGTLMYQAFVTTFKHTLINEKLSVLLDVRTANSYEKKKPVISKYTKLIVTVGVKAALLVTDLPDHIPVYATLIPKDTFKALQKNNHKKSSQFSAVFLDQPLARQFNLIKYALPQARRIGILISKTKTEPGDSAGNSIITIGKNANYTVILEELAQKDSLPAVLDRIYRKSDVLLVMPEAGIIDRKLASSILLSSYRYQKPVIGYSHAYVKAGALLAVYSTPEQIARYAAQSVVDMKKNSWHLSRPSYSNLFTVSVNKWLARSLGLTIRSEKWLTKKMANNEGAIAE